MEENIINNKNNKSSTIIIIILVIFILGLLGYIAYDNGIIFNKEKVKENNTQNDNKDNNEIDQKVEISLVEADKIYNDSMPYLKREHIYPTSSFSIKDITNIELITSVFNMDKVNYCIYDTEGLKESITLEEINAYLDKIIPTHHKITLSDLKVNGAEVSLTMADYQYTDEYGIKLMNDKIYLVGSCHSMDTPFGDIINTKTIKATKENDTVTIYRKVAFGKSNFDKVPEGSTDIPYDYYNNYNMTGKVIESISIKQEDYDDIDNYNIDYNKYNTYKYTFIENDGIYQIKSIEVE